MARKPKPPPPGYTVDELAHLAHLHPRTIRRAVKRGLIAKPVFRAALTRYTDDDLTRLRAIYHLHHRERRPLAEILRRVARLPTPELVALVTPPELAPPPPPPAPRQDVWRRVVLREGLELQVREDLEAQHEGLVEALVRLGQAATSA
jgi:DNA-binding transcriptional MerR regulator